MAAQLLELAVTDAIAAGAEEHSPVELRFAREKLAEAHKGMEFKQYDKSVYLIEQLPDPIDLDIGAATYRCAFWREGGQVVYERKLVVNAITFTAAQYQNVKAFFDRVHQADRTLISFKQK